MDTIVFIDDDIDVRDTYELSMSLMFSNEYKILCLDVKPSIEEMVKLLNEINDKVIYFVDEKLKHSGVANYTGVELVEQLRIFDEKIPIYILTSYSDEIEQYLGDIEFVIDKNDWGLKNQEENLKKRFLRHIHTYKDIKSKKAERFEFLLEKSLSSALSEKEIEEFKALDLSRIKNVAGEGIISEESLHMLKAASDELDLIFKELQKDDYE